MRPGPRIGAALVALAVAGAAVALIRCGRGAQPPAGRTRAQRPARKPHRPLPGQPTAAQRIRSAAEPDGDLGIEGVVLDESDRPVAAALVGVDGLEPMETWTDGDGAFRFTTLLPRTYQIEARHEGRYAGPISVMPRRDQPPLVLRLRPGGTLAVRVRDPAGAPIPGAIVELLSPAASIESAGGDGVAVLAGVTPGYQRLRVSAPAYATEWAHADVKANARQSLDVTLHPGSRITGRVVDPSGAPVAGARVAIEQCEDASQSAAAPATTDAAGRWELPGLPAGTYLLVAGHLDFAPGQAFVDLGPSLPPSEVTIKLARGSRLTGQVVDPAGTPVAGARITASMDPADSPGYVFSPPVQTWSDPAGAFAFGGIAEETVVITVDHDTGGADPVTVAPARQPHVVITLPGGGLEIRGEVLDSSGAPIAGASVTSFLVRPESTEGDPWRRAGGGRTRDATGPDGRFGLTGLVAGEWSLDVVAAGFSTHYGVVRAGDTAVRITLVASARARGRVRLSSGAVPADFTIGRGFNRVGGTRFQDTGGEFVLENLTPGPLHLEISGPDFTTTPIPERELRAGEDADLGTIIVSTGRALRGRLLLADGSPAAGAWVRAGRNLDTFVPELKSTSARPDGTFEIEGMPEHPFEVKALGIDRDVPAGTADVELGVLQAPPPPEGIDLGDLIPDPT